MGKIFYYKYPLLISIWCLSFEKKEVIYHGALILVARSVDNELMTIC